MDYNQFKTMEVTKKNTVIFEIISINCKIIISKQQYKNLLVVGTQVINNLSKLGCTNINWELGTIFVTIGDIHAQDVMDCIEKSIGKD